MGISGLVVKTAPGCASEVAKSLSEKERVEVCGVDDAKGAIVVVLDEDTLEKEVDKFNEVSQTAGVISATVAYHHFGE